MSVQKVALITASSAGLGAQVARALAPDFRIVSSVHLGIPLQILADTSRS
jgi:NAD(P)-dependent dehydrogenase (short-subunit alcohol dehydrogenase family)